MKRQELKFIFEEQDQFNNFFKTNNLKLLFPKRVVSSIYYDTANLKFFRESEEGVVPRTKVRFRYYNYDNIGQLELKYTFNYYRDKKIYKNQKFKKDFNDYHLNIDLDNDLYPVLKVSYLRSYFSNDLGRFTLDENISYELMRSKINSISSKSLTNEKVFELKIENNFYDYKSILEEINLKDYRNSKYCNGIQKFLYF